MINALQELRGIHDIEFPHRRKMRIVQGHS